MKNVWIVYTLIMFPIWKELLKHDKLCFHFWIFLMVIQYLDWAIKISQLDAALYKMSTKLLNTMIIVGVENEYLL